VLLIVVLSFVLWAARASRATFTIQERGFDWEFASVFETPIGTILSALATASERPGRVVEMGT
jgi:hypothetical protein